MSNTNTNNNTNSNTNTNNNVNDDEGDLYIKERQLTDSSCQRPMSNRSEQNVTKF